MSKIVDLFFAARPLLHLPIWSVYLVALHYHLQLSGRAFHWWHLAAPVGVSLLAAGAYYINQIYDCESDRINQKLGFLQGRMITPNQMWLMAFVCLITPLPLAYVYSKPIFWIFVQLLLFAFVYSMPPLRLKDRPLGGLLANSYCFGFLISLTIMPDLNVHNAGLLGWDLPFYFLLAVGSVHIMTTLPDREGDRLTGKRTLAVAFGPNLSRLAALLLMAASAIVAWRSGFALPTYISIFSAWWIVVAMLLRNGRLDLLAAKLPILLLTILAGYFYPFYLLFIVALIFACRVYYFKRFGIIYPRLA